jgi:hypothetical protein
MILQCGRNVRRYYDHNFRRFSPILGEKWRFSQKTNVTEQDVTSAGLPDGKFSNKKNSLGKFWTVL